MLTSKRIIVDVTALCTRRSNRYQCRQRALWATCGDGQCVISTRGKSQAPPPSCQAHISALIRRNGRTEKALSGLIADLSIAFGRFCRGAVYRSESSNSFSPLSYATSSKLIRPKSRSRTQRSPRAALQALVHHFPRPRRRVRASPPFGHPRHLQIRNNPPHRTYRKLSYDATKGQLVGRPPVELAGGPDGHVPQSLPIRV